MAKKSIKAKVLPAKHPVSRERLGEIAEGLLNLLAEARAEKKRKAEKEERANVRTSKK